MPADGNEIRSPREARPLASLPSQWIQGPEAKTGFTCSDKNSDKSISHRPVKPMYINVLAPMILQKMHVERVPTAIVDHLFNGRLRKFNTACNGHDN